MKILKIRALKYALIMSGVTGFCLFMMQLTGQNDSFDSKSPFQFLFMFIAPPIVWYFGIRDKKKANKGKLHFKQGVMEGAKISLAYGLISPFVFLLYYGINPTILEYVKQSYNMSSSPTAVVIAIDMTAQFIGSIIFGTFYGAIISLILRSKKK